MVDAGAEVGVVIVLVLQVLVVKFTHLIIVVEDSTELMAIRLSGENRNREY